MIVAEVSPGEPARFAAWHAALTAGASAGRPGATVESLAEARTSLGDPSPRRRRRAFAAFEGDGADAACLGALLIEYQLDHSLDLVDVEMDVPPEHRRRGVGSALWRRAQTEANALGRHLFHSEVYVPGGQDAADWPGPRFAAANGFRVAHAEDHLVLDLPAAVEREHEPAGDDGYRLEEWQGPIPERHLVAFARLRTAMDADVPTGELTTERHVHTADELRAQDERTARNWLTLTQLALSPAGEPVGYSVVFVPRSDDENAHQDDTLVLRAHHGHGLGTRMKAANLRVLAARHPSVKVLHTYTAPQNAPMQAINARFGFRKLETLYAYERDARA